MQCLIPPCSEFSKTRDNADRTHLDSFGKSCVPLQGHSHGGVDTGCEGDVDEGHQDGDGLEQGQVLQENRITISFIILSHLSWG